MTAAAFAWVFNLDAEFELARPGYTTPRRLAAQLLEHGRGALVLMGPRDVPVGPDLPDARERIGRAWCPTPAAVATLRRAGVEPEPYPPEEVLRKVNHRRFALERGGGLPGQRYVESVAELTAVLKRPPPAFARGWLLKRPLAFAGRGQLRLEGQGGALDAKQQAWVAASLRQDGLVVEPLVTPQLELSLHGFVWREGHFRLGQLCVQEVSFRGVFRAVKRASAGQVAAAETQAVTGVGARVARALSAAGYFGPFGIDAYRHPGGLCTLSEINARYTLGFAVGFPEPASALHL